MKVHVDTRRCSGHAQCAVNGPDVFELDEFGYAVPFRDVVPSELAEQARAGADACPERAITVED